MEFKEKGLDLLGLGGFTRGRDRDPCPCAQAVDKGHMGTVKQRSSQSFVKAALAESGCVYPGTGVLCLQSWQAPVPYL